jgi:hypothetical protein
MKRRIASAATCLAFLVLLRGDSCGQPVLQDPTFRLWCGEELCAWKTEAGSVRKAPTWHEADTGVEFVGTPARIGQNTPSTAQCLRFTSVADVSPSAQMSLTIDWDLDGTPDYTYPVPSVSFRQVQADFILPPHEGMRVVLEKKGSGNAVLAEIRLQLLSSADCASAPPPEPRKNLPLGARASSGTECRSRVVIANSCGECDPYAPQRACGEGVACTTRGNGGVYGGFTLCDRKGERTAGEACGIDADCKSGACTGVRSVGMIDVPTKRATDEGDQVVHDYVLCTPGAGAPAGCIPKVFVAGTCQ